MPTVSQPFTSTARFCDHAERIKARRASFKGPVIVIPAGTCAQASGANELIRAAKREIIAGGLAGRVQLRVTGCHGFCQMEPSVLVEPAGTFYPKVTAANIGRIVTAALEGRIVEDLLFVDPDCGTPVANQRDIPFYRKQVRTLLGRNESVDPLRIDDYLAIGGYAAFLKALDRKSPALVLDEIKKSGLRGRGGAGFATGVKWEALGRQSAERGKILICNADEGDPGAYMDRSLLEGNPHSILEAMLIGAYATGATEGVIYVRSEYPLAIKHLRTALRQAEELGLLGADILGSGFGFTMSIVKGAGAFVCGEETALMHSIEGLMGEPRQRPPFPVQRGIRGKPTSINNVETWANIPVIIERGADAFRAVGTPNNAGTKIFSLVGKVRYTGLVEIPMGMSIAEIVNDIGGGPAGTAAVKGVQTGGPSGGCIPSSMFDLAVDYDSLARAGAIMGSGGMIVMDEGTCMVDVARYFMHFLKDESCGKCYSCRKGTQRMHELLEDIAGGTASADHLTLLEELALVVKDSSMCGLGQTAPNPVLSMLRFFRDEYTEHIEKKRCAAAVCKELISFAIQENCTGCGACRKSCPVGAISGKTKKQHTIDTDLCTRCGACRNVCAFGAVTVFSSGR